MNTEFTPGWISPTGEFIRCHSYDHIETAREIVDNLSIESKYDSRKNRRLSEDELLLSCGWCYIGISSLFSHEWNIGWSKHLTPEQSRIVRSYIEDGGGLPVGKISQERWEEENFY